MKNWKLVVGAFGTIYFAKLLKQPGLISGTQRVQIPENDFLMTVEQYAKTKINPGDEALEVKDQNGVVKMQIILPNPDGPGQKKKTWTEEEIRGLMMTSYNLRTEDGHVRTTESINLWIAEQLLKKKQ